VPDQPFERGLQQVFGCFLAPGEQFRRGQQRAAAFGYEPLKLVCLGGMHTTKYAIPVEKVDPVRNVSAEAACAGFHKPLPRKLRAVMRDVIAWHGWSDVEGARPYSIGPGH